MGAAASFLGLKVSFTAADKASKEDAAEAAAQKAAKRKNSLALSISKFMKVDNDNYQPLIQEVRKHKDEQNPARNKPNNRDDKWSKAAAAICQGSFRELRTQVVLNFKTINRHYKDKFLDFTLLHLVCQEGYVRMLEFMLDPKSHSEYDETVIDIEALNTNNRTALQLCFTPSTGTYCATHFGISEDLIPLSERPEDVEIQSDWIQPQDVTSREKCINILVDHGANANVLDMHNYSCLHYAAMYGWESVARTLINAGVEINIQTAASKTALHLAVEYMHDDVVQLLTSTPGIDIDCQDSEGFTPLLLAVTMGEIGYDIAEILCKAGCDVNILTHRRKSAFMIACRAQILSLIHLLMNHKCVREPGSLSLLDGEVEKAVQKRIDAEEKKAAAEAAAAEKAKQAAIEAGNYEENPRGNRNKSPWGAWVQYEDKRTGNIFYYNQVSRTSVWNKPKDFKKDHKRQVKKVTYGMHFYH
jgi:ankyrin repeat protein